MLWSKMNNDMPWVNLTQEEVEELRNKKQELTEYGKEKIRRLAQEGISKYDEALRELKMTEHPTHEEMLEIAEQREKENDLQDAFYRFFAVDYFATGEGRSIWLKICRNYKSYDDKDRELEKFKSFVGHEHYYPGIEELTEREFLDKYTRMIPHMVAHMMQKRDQPMFTWETHYHFNYS